MRKLSPWTSRLNGLYRLEFKFGDDKLKHLGVRFYGILNFYFTKKKINENTQIPLRFIGTNLDYHRNLTLIRIVDWKSHWIKQLVHFIFKKLEIVNISQTIIAESG